MNLLSGNLHKSFLLKSFDCTGNTFLTSFRQKHCKLREIVYVNIIHIRYLTKLSAEYKIHERLTISTIKTLMSLAHYFLVPRYISHVQQH